MNKEKIEKYFIYAIMMNRMIGLWTVCWRGQKGSKKTVSKKILLKEKICI